MNKGRFGLAVLIVALSLAVSGCASKWVTAGKIAMNGKNWEKAITDFKNAIDENPENGEAHMYLAKCYKETQEYGKMVTHLDLADKYFPKGADKISNLRKETWQELFESGSQNAKKDDFEGARNDFTTALLIWPERYEAFTNTGYVWQRLENSDSAFYYYNRAYELAPGEMSVLENFANLCLNLGKYDLADSLYEKILVVEPGNANAIMRRGDIAREQKNFEKAVSFYKSALEISPDDCIMWFNLGVIYFQELKSTDEAINAFGRSIDLCPDDVNAQINLNVALILAERFEDAIARLESLITDYPDECIGWDLYSQTLLRQGRKKEALEAYKKFEDCDKKK